MVIYDMVIDSWRLISFHHGLHAQFMMAYGQTCCRRQFTGPTQRGLWSGHPSNQGTNEGESYPCEHRNVVFSITILVLVTHLVSQLIILAIHMSMLSIIISVVSVLYCLSALLTNISHYPWRNLNSILLRSFWTNLQASRNRLLEDGTGARRIMTLHKANKRFRNVAWQIVGVRAITSPSWWHILYPQLLVRCWFDLQDFVAAARFRLIMFFACALALLAHANFAQLLELAYIDHPGLRNGRPWCPPLWWWWFLWLPMVDHGQ